MGALPLLSVVTTVFNGEAHLAEAIESVLDQTFPDFELILVDDGSRDQTSAIIQDFAARDARIRFVNLAHVGRVEALNTGCRMARGEYLAIQDADDVALPERFESQMNFLQQHQEVALLGAGVHKITSDGQKFATVIFPTRNEEIKENLLMQGCLAHSTTVMLRCAVVEVGGYRRAFPPAEDYDLWLRLAERYEVANLPQVLVNYRVHSQQVSRTQLVKHAIATLGAQVAARLRSRGVDPTSSLDQITAEFLEEHGVSRVEINKQIVRAYLTLAITYWLCGERDLSRWTLEQALDWAQTANCHRTLLAQIRAALAAHHVKRGHILQGLATTLKSYFDDPAETKALLRRGWNRVLG
jgi:hypothetical protein